MKLSHLLVAGCAVIAAPSSSHYQLPARMHHCTIDMQAMKQGATTTELKFECGAYVQQLIAPLNGALDQSINELSVGDREEIEGFLYSRFCRHLDTDNDGTVTLAELETYRLAPQSYRELWNFWLLEPEARAQNIPIDTLSAQLWGMPTQDK